MNPTAMETMSPPRISPAIARPTAPQMAAITSRKINPGNVIVMACPEADLHSTRKDQDDQDQYDQSQTATRPIAPPPAVRPGGENPQQHQNGDHEEKGDHFGLLALHS